MSVRLYDYIVTLDNATGFVNGNTFIGQSSNTYGYITNVDVYTNTVKVKVSNAHQEYITGEVVASNHYLISDYLTIDSFIANGATSYTLVNTNPTYEEEMTVYEDTQYVPEDRYSWNKSGSPWKLQWRSENYCLPKVGSNVVVVQQGGNTNSQSFHSSNLSLGNNYTSISANIVSIASSPFINSKRLFTQPPIVRLLTIYYPGEWFPPKESGNPNNGGDGLAWPMNMPWRIAQIVGDVFSDINYNVTYRGDKYLPYPLTIDGISTSSDGTINKVMAKISNYDNLVTNLIENPYLVGNVTSNSASGYVNGELVYGLDPATVVNNVHFDQDVVDSYYGATNSSWGYSRAISMGETWEPLKYDTRDLLGAVIEIKSTFASHLQYWPEYSNVDYISANVVSVKNGAPYRIGDNVTSLYAGSTSQIVGINEENILILDNAISNIFVGDGLFIVNDEYDPEAYIRDVFKITALSTLNETFAEFELTSWLQYFKLQLPKRKFYRNTCQWLYKGPECQYPGPGGLPIPGTNPTRYSNTNPIYANNQVAASSKDDVCAKSFEACYLRNNTIHYGAYPGTGRSLPKQ